MTQQSGTAFALSLIAQSIERSPQAAILLDCSRRILLANREARRLHGLTTRALLPAVATSDSCGIARGLAQALCGTRAIPMKLSFGSTTQAFQAWRVDPLPGEKHGMVMLKADPAPGAAARLRSLTAAHAEAEERLAIAEEERQRLRRTAAQLDTIAKTDMLTGLLNAHAFRLRCASGLARGDLDGALLFVDLNGFKPVNDRFGHAAGDHVLRLVARTLRAALGEGDLVGRLGGDEFGLWLRGADAESLPDRLADLRAALAQPITRERQPGVTVLLPHGGAAIGAAVWPADGRRYEDLLATADHRMYADKPETRRDRPESRSRA
ncbi:GGDEF domain-containing protein [Ponticoccus litoralis]|uniref:GGDEF domain-containing protein n=1 Tax=Ponticoccus litoralis TaxID=422297 RepID=A0AAW9SPB9_9RHOB